MKYYFLLLISVLFSCNNSGVNKSPDLKAEISEVKQKTVKDDVETPINTENQSVDSNKVFDNGIVISWIEKGQGEKINDEDVVLIDFKVTLDDGKVVDGNHLWEKEYFPFIVGYQMQTKGWDFALRQLKVGDVANIKIPAKLARGEQGIKKEGEKGWFIPPNSDNYLTIKVIDKMKPTREVDGNKVWLFEESKKSKLLFAEDNAVQFHCMISTKSNPFYYNSYREKDPYTLYMSDRGIVPGLKKALINAKRGDRMLVLIPSSEAYGSKGLEGMVKPGENLLYNILVTDVTGK
ncbi:FKBP-type peptidyl-prolyl cis-trans isomerase [Crocinitomicaceae bacterium]|nr:FKBP-type peptidyl-prolyl cis-trans isomerase [Crocinitomicaceae bacterium]